MSYGNGACRKWPRKRQASAYGTRGDSHHIAATPASAYGSVSAWASAIGRDDDGAVTGPIQARIASRVPGASGTSPSPVYGRRCPESLPPRRRGGGWGDASAAKRCLGFPLRPEEQGKNGTRVV